jgi:hypothetical protein
MPTYVMHSPFQKLKKKPEPHTQCVNALGQIPPPER